MDPEIRDRVQGHAPRTEGEGYGDVSPEATLREIKLLPRYEIAAEAVDDVNSDSPATPLL